MLFLSTNKLFCTRQSWRIIYAWMGNTRLLILAMSLIFLSMSMLAHSLPFEDKHCYVDGYIYNAECGCRGGTSDKQEAQGIPYEYADVYLSIDTKFDLELMDSASIEAVLDTRETIGGWGFVLWDTIEGLQVDGRIEVGSDYGLPMFNQYGIPSQFNYTMLANGLRKNAHYYFKNPSEEDDYFRCSTDHNGLFNEVKTGFSLNDIKVIRERHKKKSELYPIEPVGHQLSVASLYTHVRSTPSGINCEYGKGDCFYIFDHGQTVQLEVLSVHPTLELAQHGYDLVWEGSSGCNKQQLVMNQHRNCLARLYGKQSAEKTVQNQLELLNFSGHDLLLGGANDLILGFILEGEGSTDVTLHADILDTGVVPQLTLNQILQDEAGHHYGSILTQQQHLESFTLNQTVSAGLYTLQMSSNGVLGRSLAGISLQNNTLDLTNISVRGYLQDQLVLNFIVNGAGIQQVQVIPNILEGEVETQLKLLNLNTGEEIAQADIIEVTAGAYAAILSVLSGQGIGMINVNLLK